MVLTRTRFIPDHNDTTTTSPLSLPDKASKQSFPFMRLPVEIRLQVYKDYLIDRYSLSAAEIYETVLDRDHRTKRPPEILQVSKAVNAEVKDILRQKDTFTLRVCCQDATFDGLVRSCFQTKGLSLEYENIAHLRIEVYPPHQDRPDDVKYIWSHFIRLCCNLRKATYVQHLSVHLLENEYAAWSSDGRPSDTIFGTTQTLYRSPQPFAIPQILIMLQFVTGVAKAQIHLPAALSSDMPLNGLRLITENVMMKRRPR